MNIIRFGEHILCFKYNLNEKQQILELVDVGKIVLAAAKTKFSEVFAVGKPKFRWRPTCRRAGAWTLAGIPGWRWCRWLGWAWSWSSRARGRRRASSRQRPSRAAKASAERRRRTAASRRRKRPWWWPASWPLYAHVWLQAFPASCARRSPSPVGSASCPALGCSLPSRWTAGSRRQRRSPASLEFRLWRPSSAALRVRGTATRRLGPQWPWRRRCWSWPAVRLPWCVPTLPQTIRTGTSGALYSRRLLRAVAGPPAAGCGASWSSAWPSGRSSSRRWGWRPAGRRTWRKWQRSDKRRPGWWGSAAGCWLCPGIPRLSSRKVVRRTRPAQPPRLEISGGRKQKNTS